MMNENIKKPWTYLPSVVICEILGYLSPSERLNVTSVCKRWRSCLWYPQFWRKFHCRLLSADGVDGLFNCQKKIELIAGFVQEAIIEFDSCDHLVLNELYCVIKALCRSEKAQLQKLVLRPSSSQLIFHEHSPNVTLKSFLLELRKLLFHSKATLKHLSLGCSFDLIRRCSTLLSALRIKSCVPMLEVLHLASIRDEFDPLSLNLNPKTSISTFSNLHTLGIDYDHLYHNLLCNLSESKQYSLRKLIIHVHQVIPDQEFVKDEIWHRLNSSGSLEVTLNLLHTISGMKKLDRLLSPVMPLIHFRSFFCSSVNIEGINFIRNHLCSKLQSICIIDGLSDDRQPVAYDSNSSEDPFVMLAWKALSLESFTLIGYKICDDDVVAIARLRKDSLKTFKIPHCCVDSSSPAIGSKFSDMVSESLGFPWMPIPDDELHPAIFDPHVDAETAYLSMLHADQD